MVRKAYNVVVIDNQNNYYLKPTFFQLVCSVCGHTSVKYDPFGTLSVPLPYANQIQICKYCFIRIIVCNLQFFLDVIDSCLNIYRKMKFKSVFFCLDIYVQYEFCVCYLYFLYVKVGDCSKMYYPKSCSHYWCCDKICI